MRKRVIDVACGSKMLMKKNFCDRCGQRIDWESVEKEES